VALGGEPEGRRDDAARGRDPNAGPRGFPDDELVTYCQGGVRAAHAALALRVAGYPRVRVYDGSWTEWGNDPALPIEPSEPSPRTPLKPRPAGC
jgi:thiosulfate/3-mercaptopyruvate sulfurtransferase